MEWIFIIVIVTVIWFLIKKSSSDSERERAQSRQQNEEPSVTVTVTSSRRGGKVSDDADEIDVGELTSVGDRVWVLNPAAPLPLTLLNADLAVAKEVRKLLGTREYWSNKVPDLALLIAQHNLRVKEVDVFVAAHKKGFTAEVDRQIAESTEWPSASEKDRRDLRAEFQRKALDSLGVWTGRADLAVLLEGEPAAFTEDDELLRLFGGDSTLYSFYLSSLGRSSSVATVKADDYSRKSWERLAEMGLARRGKEIPVPLILESLRLKDVNVLLSDVVDKPIGRKAKAIEVAVALPDIVDRLSREISFREMFQVLRPADMHIDNLVASFSYANTLATIVQQTYFTGVRTLEAIEQRRRDPDIYDAWEISNWEDPLPSCASKVCRKYERLPAKKPPFHVGCSCQLECSFKE